jgi:galactose mutarotase-like enzyme
MQKAKWPDFENRLYPNDLMKFIAAESAKSGNSAFLAAYARFVTGHLPEIVTKIADNNIDVYHDFFTRWAAGADRSASGLLGVSVSALKKYIEQQLTKTGTEKAKAETACAIAADIVKRYMHDEAAAKKFGAIIGQVGKDLYNERKAQLLEGIFGDRPRPEPVLIAGGEKLEFRGTCPNRKCDSSAVGSDALYALHLDPDGGMAINYPVLFSETREGDVRVPTATARRIEDNRIALCAISNTGANAMVITPENVDDLFSARDNKVFTDKEELYFLKYALFYAGIIGPGLATLGLPADQIEQIRKNPMHVAQAYYDALQRGDRARVAQAVFGDIARAMRNGGIELRCDNHASPLAAGFSSSSTASISILRALYAMTGQSELLEPQVSADMAIIFENDLGRSSGDQDTTGTLPGVHNIVYGVENSKMVRSVNNIEVAPSVLAELERRTFVFAPGISRAASAGIGARQNAYLLREPDALAAIKKAMIQHEEIMAALVKGDFAVLGRLEWEYTENRAKIHADALPDEMRTLFNWLMGKEDLVVRKDEASGGSIRLTRPPKPLILGGELAGSMGTGAASSLIASDFGLETNKSGETELEAALKQVIRLSPYFKNAYLRYLRMSPEGPGTLVLPARIADMSASLKEAASIINEDKDYTVNVVDAEGHVLVELIDNKNGGARVTIMVDRGFRVMSWVVAGKERLLVPETIDTVSGGLFSMFPQVNRVERGRFNLFGKTVETAAIAGMSKDGDTGNTIHGPARGSDVWKNVKIGVDAEGVYIRAEFATTDHPGLAEAFGPSTLTKTYRLKGGELTIDDEVEGQNAIADVGEHPMARFTPGQTTIEMQGVEGVYPVNEQKLPTGEPIADAGKDFSTPKPFEGLDNTLMVRADKEGKITATVADHAQNTATTYTMSGELFSARPGKAAPVHVWSGKAQGDRLYGIGAVEAVNVAANGPNRQGQAGGTRPFTEKSVRKGRVVISVKEIVSTTAGRAAGIDEEIRAATALAEEAARGDAARQIPAIPTYADDRYTLLLTEEFYSNGELEEHRARYGQQFNLDKVSGQTPEQFIDNVIAKAAGRPGKTVALIPDVLASRPDLIKRLTVEGIRVVMTSGATLMQARASRDPDRIKFQVDTYATMLLVRHITADMPKDSAAYRTLSFFLKTHFGFTAAVTVDEYIEAITKNEVARLILGYLRYRPIAPYNAKKEYEGIAKALISA